MKKLFILLLSCMILAGCAQSLSKYHIENIDSIPNITYEMYTYAGGEGRKLRAVFLKDPTTDVEVVPYSIQITKSTGSLDDALAFMTTWPKYKKVYIDAITYKGTLAGYIITHSYHPFKRYYIEPHIFERNGKIFFSVWESELIDD